MKLQISTRIDDNRVRLDFRNSPGKPHYTPSYEIDKSKADEFIKEYNKQEKKLQNITTYSIGIAGLIGFLATFKKHSFKHSFIGTLAGLIAGFGIGAGISAHKKNELMDKYDVKEYSK
ncbi:hypothetical protein IJ541_04970 [bacterium]|nr:hypothetical protein [bacterium]